jgi:hypothetical protein
VSGREVRAWRVLAGDGQVGAQRWDGRDQSGRRAAGGVYFVRLEADSRAETRRLVVLR